jgi:hypothetical protein
MNIGNLSIHYNKKPKDIKFVNVSLLEGKLKKDSKNLKSYIKNDYQIYDQYRYEAGVIFLLFKD